MQPFDSLKKSFEATQIATVSNGRVINNVSLAANDLQLQVDTLKKQLTDLPAIVSTNTEKSFINLGNKVNETFDWKTEAQKNTPKVLSTKFGKCVDPKNKSELTKAVLINLGKDFIF